MALRSILLLFFLLPTWTLAGQPFEAKVVGITDGDTLKVLTDEKQQIKIRLAEIDTPEKKQPWGNRAKQALSGLAFGKLVDVHPVTIDRYSRTVAHLYVGDLRVNREMVRTGNAWVYRRYLKDKTLLDAESEARQNGRGLWGLPEAQRMAPWEWRRKR